MSLLFICYGTRPEYIKVLPVIQQYKYPKRVCYTGQHTTLLDGEDIISDVSLGAIPETSGNRLNDIMIHILSRQHSLFQDCSAVMVQGDTTTALAMALCAFHQQIPVIHLEAGLRTYNSTNPFPEEANRKMISAIAQLHLCPTAYNKLNLETEKCSGEKYVVGNTGLDSLSRPSRSTYNNQVIITMHRRENNAQMELWFQTIEQCAASFPELDFIFPMHPSPAIQKFRSCFHKVRVVHPMSHTHFTNLVVQCRFVISDSGGLQEECAFFNKKIIVCRETTERPESVGKHSLLCRYPDQLLECVQQCHIKYKIDEPCPFGDGHASERIIPILYKLMNTLKTK